MLYKESTKITSNSKQNRQKTQNRESRKSSFLKEQVKNADLYKPVLKKIMTTHKEYLKLDFVAPLNCILA